MAKKNHYYVLVFTNAGAVYVTSIDSTNKYARWDKDKAPMEFSKSYAEDLVMGLNLNFNSSVLVVSPFEIGHQPYNYEMYDCEFIAKKL